MCQSRGGLLALLVPDSNINFLVPKSLPPLALACALPHAFGAWVLPLANKPSTFAATNVTRA